MPLVDVITGGRSESLMALALAMDAAVGLVRVELG